MLVLEKTQSKKRIFTTRGKKPDNYKELNGTKNLIKDFNKIENKIDFYNQLESEMIFERKNNCIQIITSYLFHQFLKAGAEVNKSLEIIQKQSQLKFKTLIETLIEKIELDIKDFKRLITNWSNEKYILKIDKKIAVVNQKTQNVLTLDKNNFRKLESQLDFEIAFFFRRNLFSLLNKTLSLITQDYSHLYDF